MLVRFKLQLKLVAIDKIFSFQFYVSAIQTLERLEQITVNYPFQFYVSAIQTIKKEVKKEQPKPFQFYVSAIQTGSFFGRNEKNR